MRAMRAKFGLVCGLSFGLTCGILCALVCVVAPPRVLASDAPWVEVHSANFSVLTDAGDKKGREVALHFEQMRNAFGMLMGRAKINLPVPLEIVAFRNEKEMMQVTPLFEGKPTELAGLFQGGEDRSFIVLNVGVEDPWSVVFHEYAHRLLDGNVAFRMDPWFEEGFAEYFSSIEVDNKEARVGKIPEQTYEILQLMGMMKVSDLFEVKQDSKTYNENGDHRTTFYAESGLVVHYLYDNGLIPRLAIYFDAVHTQKKPVDAAIRAAFGMTAEQLDKALRSYLASGKYRYYPMRTVGGIAAGQFAVTPVTAANALATIADIHAHSPDYQGVALGEFRDVLKMEPGNISALRGAGFACLQKKDYACAEENLRQAASRDAKDARVHFYYAMVLDQHAAGDKQATEEVKRELAKAIEIDPNLADAYSLLGYTQATSGEPELAVANLRRALEMSPRNARYLFNLASAYMGNGKMNQANKILRDLTASADPEVAKRAKEILEQEDWAAVQNGALSTSKQTRMQQ